MDLDKIVIMNEFFKITTDYIIKGIEFSNETKNNNNYINLILYITSTALLFIGLLCVFSGWYEEQS